jgi:hypothetical protein
MSSSSIFKKPTTRDQYMLQIFDSCSCLLSFTFDGFDIDLIDLIDLIGDVVENRDDVGVGDHSVA